MIVPLEQKAAPFWRYSWFEDMILLSSFHMTHEALPLYLKALVDFEVNIIQAYPSSILTLAKYLESKNQYFARPLKSIITSSEMLTEDDRLLIQERFNCPVFDWYGLFERVAAIAMCEHGRYHILTDYSFVELVAADDGKIEIIGTNFNNRYQPLIRYKTGDHVVLSDEQQCPCGRAYPVVSKIEGRVGDYLLAEDGQKVSILNHIPKGVDGLLSCQFIQDEVNLINILVVVDKNRFDKKQEGILIANAKTRLGNSISFLITPVDSLPRTRNGKVRQAVCNVEFN
jgi:phenylacetate-CoA ligase